MASFVDLSWAVDGVLDAFPDEVEAALESGFYFSNRGVYGIVNCTKEPRDLVDDEKRIGVEDKRDDDFPGRERASFEGSVASVSEPIATVSTSESGTVVPALDGGFTAFWTGSLFPGLLTAPLDTEIERLWAQHY